MKEGDRYTEFFHIMANSHKRRNTLLNISINGKRLAQDTKIKEGLVDEFQNLLFAPNSWRPPLPDLPFNVIGDEQAAKLEEMFTKEEILAAIFGLNRDKAPSPYGFPLAFWSFNWDFVKDILGFFKEFYEHNKFVKSLNATFLVLIPKKCNVEDFKDLRPISLVGGLYKILTKVLANIIKRVMSLIISQAQNAFIEGRQILDAILIANEAMDSIMRKKESELLCKLDIETTYSHISWNFLFQILEKMGFDRK